MQPCTSLIVICLAFLLENSLAVEPRNSSALCKDKKIININNLGFSLLNKLTARQGNVLISPVGIAFNLGILYSAASNETATQIKKILIKNGTRATVEHVEEELNQVIDDLSNSDSKFSIKNEMICEECKFINNDYISNLKKKFASNVKLVEHLEDLKTSDDDSDSKKNDIPSLQVVNSLAFNTSWKVQFVPERTDRDYFYSGRRETTSVWMMIIESETFNFYEDYKMRYKFIELPYENEDLSMMLALPTQYDVQANLRMSSRKFCRIKSKLVPTKLDMISIPKFHFEEEKSFKDELVLMGMENAFNESIAQFPGLSTDEGFHVSDLKQTIKIEVDEDGVESASNTDPELSVAFRGVKEFIANHPFLFYVEDRKTGTIIVTGRIDEPSDLVSFSHDLRFQGYSGFSEPE